MSAHLNPLPPRRPIGLLASFVLLLLALSACNDSPPPADPATAAKPADPPAEVAPPSPLVEKLLLQEFHDDLDGMLARGMIRVAVTHSKTHYFIEKGRQYGMTSETLHAFENHLRQRYKAQLKGRSLSVVPIPVRRNQLFSLLESGHADLAVANLTITDARMKRADFTQPTLNNVSEILVSGTHVTPPGTIEALSGKRVVLRRSSSFHHHLEELNARLKNTGQAPVQIIAADEYLETEDLLEMLDAGLIEYTVADAHIAELWAKVFANIRVHPELVIKKDRQIAWALRKGTPQLMAEANRFLKRHRVGTQFGNVLKQRYLENPYWAKRALEQSELSKFTSVAELFRKYADQYQFDYLMLIAQGYQESQLDQSRRSPVGAVGIMQVMPETGKAMAVGDIHQLEANIHAGTKYMRTLIDTYFADPEIDDMNRVLLAFAAYNSGPTRLQKLRRRTAKAGLNPNVWFGNVEHTVARHVGQEPVRYVANIAKYYVAYRLAHQQLQEKQARKSSVALR
jgi:membrane-bound lytic murein transglycosylase MltF